MNVAETARICRAIASMKPAQRFDDETPAFWQLVLADVRYEDARDAVVTLARGRGFIGTDDIVAEVKRVRADRIDRAGEEAITDLILSGGLTRFEAVKAIADGAQVPSPKAIDAAGAQEVTRALQGATRRPPRALPADYGDRPRQKAIEPPRELSATESARLEQERARQLAAIATMTNA